MILKRCFGGNGIEGNNGATVFQRNDRIATINALIKLLVIRVKNK